MDQFLQVNNFFFKLFKFSKIINFSLTRDRCDRSTFLSITNYFIDRRLETSVKLRRDRCDRCDTKKHIER